MALEFMYSMECAAALMRYSTLPGVTFVSLSVLGLLNLLFPDINCNVKK